MSSEILTDSVVPSAPIAPLALEAPMLSGGKRRAAKRHSPKPKRHSPKKYGGSLSADLTNVALPFGLMFAHHMLKDKKDKKDKKEKEESSIEEKGSQAKRSPKRLRNLRVKTVGGSDIRSIAGFPDAPVAPESAMAGGAELQVGAAPAEHQELPKLGGGRRRPAAKHSSPKKSPRRHSPKKSPRRH
jgi:hypothetical protein